MKYVSDLNSSERVIINAGTSENQKYDSGDTKTVDCPVSLPTTSAGKGKDSFSEERPGFLLLFLLFLYLIIISIITEKKGKLMH